MSFIKSELFFQPDPVIDGLVMDRSFIQGVFPPVLDVALASLQPFIEQAVWKLDGWMDVMAGTTPPPADQIELARQFLPSTFC